MIVRLCTTRSTRCSHDPLAWAVFCFAMRRLAFPTRREHRPEPRDVHIRPPLVGRQAGAQCCAASRWERRTGDGRDSGGGSSGGGRRTESSQVFCVRGLGECIFGGLKARRFESKRLDVEMIESKGGFFFSFPFQHEKNDPFVPSRRRLDVVASRTWGAAARAAREGAMALVDRREATCHSTSVGREDVRTRPPRCISTRSPPLILSF